MFNYPDYLKIAFYKFFVIPFLHLLYSLFCGVLKFSQKNVENPSVILHAELA